MWLPMTRPRSAPPPAPDPNPPHASPPTDRWWLLRYLYTQNPFYVISAVLMLFAVRSAYGTLDIGAINCWMMLGVLATYTLVLATIAVVLVRLGGVWDDARSLLLLLVLMFLALSIGADDLFVNATTAGEGLSIAIAGFLFSAAVSEAVLRLARVRLAALFRLPYHALLAMFFVAPWALAIDVDTRDPAMQSWALLAFPTVAAGLFLLLIPAARRGPGYTAGNGTPYPWPWYPWTVFGGFAAAVAVRSYVLSMTYGLVGPIWTTKGAIAFDTIWGPYFLVPLAFALLLLVLEAGLALGDRRVQRRALFTAPFVLLMAVPILGGEVHGEFLETVTLGIGSPLWLTVWMLMAFTGWAAVRRVGAAFDLLLVSTLLLTYVGPGTIDPSVPASPLAWPPLLVGAILLVRGVRSRSSALCTLALAPIVAGVWWALDVPAARELRFATAHGAAWLGVVVIGLSLRDDFARALRWIGAMWTVVFAGMLVGHASFAALGVAGRLAACLAVMLGCLVVARLWRSRAFFVAFLAITGIGVYGGSVLGFRAAVASFGRSAVTAFSWSVATLLLGFLISAHKARWLSPTSRWARSPGADTRDAPT